MDREEGEEDNDGIAEIDCSLGGGCDGGKVESGDFWAAVGNDLATLVSRRKRDRLRALARKR